MRPRVVGLCAASGTCRYKIIVSAFQIPMTWPPISAMNLTRDMQCLGSWSILWKHLAFVTNH